MEEFYDFQLITKEMKRLRIEHSCTQEQLATQLGCTPAFISNIENNKVRLNLRVLTYYARLFHVSVDSILNAGSKTGISQDKGLDGEALDVLHQFPPAEQEKIIKVLRYIASNFPSGTHPFGEGTGETARGTT